MSPAVRAEWHSARARGSSPVSVATLSWQRKEERYGHLKNLAATEVNSALFCWTQGHGSSAGRPGGRASLPLAGSPGRRPAVGARSPLGSDCVRRVLPCLPAWGGFPGVLWEAEGEAMRTCPTSCGGGRRFNFYITLRAVAETARNAVRSPSARPASCFALRLRGRSTAGDVFVLRDSASRAHHSSPRF